MILCVCIILVIIFVILFAIYYNLTKSGGDNDTGVETPITYTIPVTITDNTINGALKDFDKYDIISNVILTKVKRHTHNQKTTGGNYIEKIKNYIKTGDDNEFKEIAKFIVQHQHEDYTIFGAPDTTCVMQESEVIQEDREEIMKKLFKTLYPDKEFNVPADFANPDYTFNDEIRNHMNENMKNIFKVPNTRIKYIFTIFKNDKIFDFSSAEQLLLKNLSDYIQKDLFREKYNIDIKNIFYVYIKTNDVTTHIYAEAIPTIGQIDFNSFSKNRMNLIEYIRFLGYNKPLPFKKQKVSYGKRTNHELTDNQKKLSSKIKNAGILKEYNKSVVIINLFHGRKTVFLTNGVDFYIMELVVNDAPIFIPKLEPFVDKYNKVMGNRFPYAIVRLEKLTQKSGEQYKYLILPCVYTEICDIAETFKDFVISKESKEILGVTGGKINTALKNVIKKHNEKHKKIGSGDGEWSKLIDVDLFNEYKNYISLKAKNSYDRYKNEDFSSDVIKDRYVLWIIKKSMLSGEIDEPVLCYNTDPEIIKNLVNIKSDDKTLIYFRLFSSIGNNNLHFKVEKYTDSKYFEFAQLLFTVSNFVDNNTIIYYENYKKLTDIDPNYYTKGYNTSLFMHYGIRNYWIEWMKKLISKKSSDEIYVKNPQKNNLVIQPTLRPIEILGKGENKNIFDMLTVEQYNEIESLINLRSSFAVIRRYVDQNKEIDEELIKITNFTESQIKLIYNSFKNSSKIAASPEQLLVYSFIKECDKNLLMVGTDIFSLLFPDADVYYLPNMLFIDLQKKYIEVLKSKHKNFKSDECIDQYTELKNYSISINKKYDNIFYSYTSSETKAKYYINKDGPIISNIYLDISIKYIHTLLQHLNSNGNFILLVKQFLNNDFVNKYINYLSTLFKKTSYLNHDEGIFIKFVDFIGKPVEIKVIYGDVEKQFFGNPKIDLPTPVDIDYDISPVNSTLKIMFDDYFGQFVKMYYNYEFEDKDKIKNNLIYERLNRIREIYKENNLKFDDYFTAELTNYNKTIYQEFMSMNSTVFLSLIAYNKKSKIGNILDKNSSEGYDEFKKYGYVIFANKEVVENALDRNKIEYKLIKNVSEDFTRGVAAYLLKHYDLGIRRASNAFVKLWEIYTNYPVITENIRAFHMCEAPGQWIKTTERFINVKTNVKYEWVANSLNPTNAENIEKFGNDIINDQYGLLKDHKNKWLFGEDDTGDITVSKNILWYRKNVNANLVTGDAGIPTTLPLVYMQKLDYSQYLITIAVADKGANCVIKCFTQYLPKHKSSLDSSGFFVNLLYLYFLSFETVYLYKPYASGSISGEFYIIGLGFLGVSDDELEKLLKIQDNFEENNTFFARTNIPEYFVAQVEQFTKDMTYHKVHALNRFQFLINVMNDKEDKYEFKELLKNIDTIHEARFKEWIKLFRFS